MFFSFSSVFLSAYSVLLVIIQLPFGNKIFRCVKGERSSRGTPLQNFDKNQIQFVLFTRDYPPTNLVIGDEQGFEYSGFNISNPTKVIIHGYISSIEDEVFTLNKNAYLETGDYNVIGMDWSKLNDAFYIVARSNAITVGHKLGDFLKFLIVNCGVDSKDVHLIGHSLGAHIAGIGAGSLKGYSIGRITGLDPASPGFTFNRQDQFLDAGDADLVDVIHTFTRALSLLAPIGHVDFYPNGGKFQRGCPSIYDIWRLDQSMLCHHGRAYQYFAESIRNKRAFKSLRCPDLQSAITENCKEKSHVYMGQANTYTNGLYYVRTHSKPPFSLSGNHNSDDSEEVEYYD